jgi:hypothetical protein
MARPCRLVLFGAHFLWKNMMHKHHAEHETRDPAGRDLARPFAGTAAGGALMAPVLSLFR